VSACPFGLNRYGTASSCSSNGACQQGTGRCACYAGYTGDVCSVCVSGYLQLTRGGACIYLPGALSSCEDGVRNGNEEGVDCGGPNCAVQCSSEGIPVVLIGAAAAAAAVILAVIALCVRRWYRRQQGTVVPLMVLKSKGAGGPKMVSLVHSRQIVLGRQHSRRRSSMVMPVINIDYTQYGDRRPTIAGNRRKGEIM
jgi:hypothetical protein